jgi:hypothetical protein
VKRKAPIKAAVSKRGRGRPKKQAKTNATTSNRLYFRLRRRENGESMVFHTPEKGFPDITNSSLVAFKGVGSIPVVGSKVPFEGLKVSAESAAQAQS